MSVKQHVVKPLVLLRRWVENNTQWFGQSMWDAPAKKVLNNDEKSVGDVIASLEQGLAGYREFLKGEHMSAADKRGCDALIARIEKIIAHANTLLP